MEVGDQGRLLLDGDVSAEGQEGPVVQRQREQVPRS